MAEKALWALIGGVGAGVGLAILPLLTKTFNAHGNYFRAVLLSIVVFALACACVMGTVALKWPARINMNWVLVGLLLSATITGLLFPLGTFGFWLGFLLVALIIPISIHGFSANAFLSLLGAMGGLVVGGITSTLLTMKFEHAGPLLGSEFVSDFISYGLIAYGLTFGLLLFNRTTH